MASDTHDHHHGQANDALDSADGIRALQISLIGLLLTAAFQGVIGVAGGSAGLLADSIHNFSDAFTAIPLWIAFVLARRAATRRFTYGYGRSEDLAGLIVLGFVIFSAGLAAWESYQKLITRSQPTLIGWGVLASIVGIIGNEVVARYKIRVGQRIGSAALVAEGQHSRIDSLTSLAAGLGLIGVWLGFPLADPIAGFIITLAILGILREVGGDILRRLLDGIEPETVDRIESLAGAVAGVQHVHDVRARWLGHAITVELHVTVDGALTVVQGHAIGEDVRTELLAHVPRLTDVVVHADPQESYLNEHHPGRETPTPTAAPAPAHDHLHDHDD